MRRVTRNDSTSEPEPLRPLVQKRKLSDLPSQETEIFLQKINNFKNDLSEDDEKEKSVIGSLEHVVMKLQSVKVSSWELFFSLFSSLNWAKQFLLD